MLTERAVVSSGTRTTDNSYWIVSLFIYQSTLYAVIEVLYNGGQGETFAFSYWALQTSYKRRRNTSESKTRERGKLVLIADISVSSEQGSSEVTMLRLFRIL